MDTLSASRAALRLGCVAALVVSTFAAQAQTAIPSVRAVPPRPAPTSTSGFGLPNPAGLPSITTPNLASPATPGGTVVDPGIVPQPNAVGRTNGGVARRSALGAGPLMPLTPLTPLQIAQSFVGADTNRDGELTPAEAQRLTIAPFPFEEMDRNHDGILTRSEYEDALR
jgi:hypothetical protein